jgi:hypothetical protein
MRAAAHWRITQTDQGTAEKISENINRNGHRGREEHRKYVYIEAANVLYDIL